MALPPVDATTGNRPDTHAKALRINLDRRRYGTFAEIGAGQEVVRWFFRVGGAAGTVAKSMSAYDMIVSDAIYGESDRYVSRSRLEAMLNHEYSLNIERLSNTKGDTNALFAFADTVSARNFLGTNECHGWMGVRFQVYPRDQETQIVIHFRLLDKAAVLQQEAIGILGVNLLYGAFHLHFEPDQLIESLHDDLGPSRVEVDMIDFSGIGFRAIDNRLMSLNLVQKGLSRAAMFGPDRNVLLPSDVFHKRPVLVERGSFRPLTNVNVDILRAATETFTQRLAPEDRDRLVSVAEITMRNLTADGSAPDPRDFLSRAEVLSAAGMTVLVSDFFEFYRLAGYLRGLTVKPLGIALGAVTIPELYDSSFYGNLEGGLLESIGRLFSGDMTLFVYPYLDRTTGELRTVETLALPPEAKPLYDYVVRAGKVVALANHDPACLPIDSRDILKKIASRNPEWEKMVPPPIVQLIKDRNLFGYKKKV
ncbi:MAG TPA: hypothetical protein VGJ05_14370 [Fimbriiglobus sp.]|jgi:hypothetical protein